MKTLITLAAAVVLAWPGAKAYGDDVQGQGSLTIYIHNLLRPLRENQSGWTKVLLDNVRVVYLPYGFYNKKIDSPAKFVVELDDYGFCQPDSRWDDFPVLVTKSDRITESFDAALTNPSTSIVSRSSYAEGIIYEGGLRNVAYDYQQSGTDVKFTCSTVNARGEILGIVRIFDIKNPLKFEIRQTRDGKPSFI